MANRYGSMQDAAAELGMSVKTIRRMIARGDIQAVRVGPRAIRVDLDTLLNTGRPLHV